MPGHWIYLFRGERELCFLPLAHAYSCAFNLLVPMAFGVHVYLLGKVPSPKILLKAFEEVKPNLILMVPLILEKIYKKMILPQLNKRTLKLALNNPTVGFTYLCADPQTFGGCLGRTFPSK